MLANFQDFPAASGYKVTFTCHILFKTVPKTLKITIQSFIQVLTKNFKPKFKENKTFRKESASNGVCGKDHLASLLINN